MRKIYILTSVLLAAIMMAATFTACSSDEDDSTGGNPFNDPDATMVTNDQELRAAMTNGAVIKLANDIDLSNSTLSIAEGTTVTINLDGHTLDRHLTHRGEGGGQVFTVRKGATLNLGYGTLKGGWGGNAGGLVNEGGTANLTDVTITGCTGDDKGGGICNLDGGTLTMTGGALTGNTSIDKDDPTGGGGLFNAAGSTVILKGVKVLDNVAKSKGGGGICNYGTLTLDSCSITGNVCGKNGGGIYNYSTATLNIQGRIYISGNKDTGNLPNNVFLKENAVITVTGALTDSDSKIGVMMEAQTGAFTSGFNANNSGVSPTAIFTSDMNPYLIISADAEEGTLTKKDEKAIYYIARDYDKYTGRITTSVKTVTDYVELKGGDTKVLDEGFYVVKGDVTYDHLDLDGSADQVLILCDGATLRVDYLNLNAIRTFFSIYGQRNNTGTLIADDAPSGQAGIGADTGNQMPQLWIHGGHIIAEGGSDAAGIGAGGTDSKGKWSNFEGIYILGGTVEATGGSNAAGIGHGPNVGWLDPVPNVYIFGGTVIAKGGEDGAGIGGGEGSDGVGVDIHGGTVYATGYDGAGIGGGDGGGGGYTYIYGGTVYARGDGDYFSNGAGIGGGVDGGGGKCYLYGGYVEAIGGNKGAGIGGGENGKGSEVVVEGGTIVAKAGLDDTGNRAIGPGEGNDDYGYLELYDQMMVKSERLAYVEERVNMCWYRTSVRIEPCTHPGYTADTCPYHKH